ncbi:urease accessory protein UreF [Actinopolyspora biskrensis]|nr:urease accessory UreF family protein [Actinopolyspora biskrensis]
MLLVLADGRFPSGNHAHSGGAEAAVHLGQITNANSLESFCRARLNTTGLVMTAVAAAAASGIDALLLDDAVDARTPSPSLRATGRKLGRQLLRAARATWPDTSLDRLATERPHGLHQPIVLGLAAAAAGLHREDAAAVSAYETVNSPISAAIRLLGIDPFEASGILARLAPELDAVTARAVESSERAERHGITALPRTATPLLEINAEWHATWQRRLFAS